jgi:hypothetical protein
MLLVVLAENNGAFLQSILRDANMDDNQEVSTCCG